MKNLYILGSTGSIGTQTLDIVRNQKEDFKVIGMSIGGTNLELGYKLIEEFKPEIVCFRKKEHMKEFSYGPILVYGDEGLNQISEYSKYENEWLVNALVGVSGLLPTVKAIKANKNIALANKETLVVAGDIINDLVKEYNDCEMPLYHMDVYRLDSDDETIGLSDYLNSDAVCIIEWSEIIADQLPEERLDIKIKVIDDETRVLVFTPHGQQYEDLCEAVL